MTYLDICQSNKLTHLGNDVAAIVRELFPPQVAFLVLGEDVGLECRFRISVDAFGSEFWLRVSVENFG